MISYFPVVTGSLTVSGSVNISGGITASGGISISGSIASASFASTASFVALAQSASNAVSAQTASFANALTVAGNLTAQTLVVQTITSSVDFVTGSTRFGSILGNTHVFSGSVTMNPGGLFVSSSGWTGIGTISPEKILTVNFGTNILGGLLITGSQRQETIFKSNGEHSNVFIDSGHSNTYLPNLSFQRLSTTYGSVSLARASSSDILGPYTESEMLVGSTTTVPFSLQTSGSRRLVITSAGNIGIGTTNPNVKLEVYASSGYGARLDGASYGGLQLAAAGTVNTYFVGASSDLNIEHTTAIVLRTNNANRLTLASTGTLSLSGTFYQVPSSGAGGFYIDRGTSSTSPYISWFNGSGTRLGYMGYSNTNVGLYLENSAAFTITGGNVGIGATPVSSVKLAVAGCLALGNTTDGTTNLSYGGRISAKQTSVTGGAGATLIHRGLGSVGYFILVSGIGPSGIGRFVDLIYGTSTATPTVLASSTGGTSAPTRTYSMSGENVAVSLSGGDTWTVTTTGLGAMEA